MQDFSQLLWYDRPAEAWTDALPLGNGRLGAMVFGGIGHERIALNEDTLWSKNPEPFPVKDSKKEVAHARELIRQRKFSEADQYIAANIPDGNSASYLPAGDLLLDFPGLEDIAAYRRELDLKRALASTVFTGKDGVTYTREAFISYPDQVLVIRLSADQPGKITFRAQLTSQLQGSCTAENGELVFAGHAPWYDRREKILWTSPEGLPGVALEMRLSARVTNGHCTCSGSGLSVENADSAVLYLTADTDFDNPITPRDHRALPEDAVLQSRHEADYRALAARCTLSIPQNELDERPSWQRLNGNPTGGTVALLFHYGRYLMIAGSRPGTLAMNLQGIWNDRLLPPWGCNYTTNINTEMNDWPAGPANLAECAEPLLTMVKKTAASGYQTARIKYGLPGWCSHHNGDGWGFSGMATGQTSWAFWPMGGAWLCCELFRVWQFSQDKEFLKELWPLLKDCAVFQKAWLTEQEGQWLTSPATSPENQFFDPATGDVAACCAGSMMDISIIKDLFTCTVETARILQQEDDFTASLPELCRRMPEHKIGQYGELLEFGEQFKEVEVRHRHLSHLYGFYPASEITQDDPELWEALRVTLARRGLFSTGWAMAWRMALQARLKNQYNVSEILRFMLSRVPHDYKVGWHDAQKGGTYANFFDAHPPFQIDGNFGAVAAIAECLVQSHRTRDGRILLELLPAPLPEWPEGKACGLRARGGITVDLTWQESRLRQATLLPDRDMEIVYANQILQLTAGVPVTING